jgi:threonine dehydratase
MSKTIPSQTQLQEARTRIGHIVHKTPVLTSSLLNELTGASLYFKCENFQRMGAFKMRGASHAIAMLTKEQLKRGVVTHSSGNFAQAVSLAAHDAGITAYIVMPENAPAVKKAAVRDYGGTIIESSNSPADRESKAEEVRKETEATFIHPSNDLQVILGNSTATQELHDEIPALDVIVAPVGGGGLIAGTALATHYSSPETVVIGAEPVGADDAFRSLRDGVIHQSHHPQTICDGLRTNLGDVNFPIIRELVSQIILVQDTETVEAMRLIYERMKIVVEPSSAIVLAAVLANRNLFAGKKVGLILSGGNIDLSQLKVFFG